MSRIDRSRMDRRALFASGAAAALLAATGVSAHNAPRRGGVLRIAVQRDGGMMEQVARRAVFDNLTEIGPDGLLRGELATHWQSEDGGSLWRFDLRAGVVFHDGVALTADRVAASLANCGLAAQALGTGQVQIALDQANPHLPYILAAPELVIAHSDDPRLPLSDAVGTGCYRVERAQEGRHFRATRLDHHYKDGSAGWVDQLELIVIPDARVRSEALRDGFVDVAALPQAEDLGRRTGFQFYPSADQMQLAARSDVGLPRHIGTRSALDDGRIGERWWRALT